MTNGSKIAHALSLQSLEKQLLKIPEESFTTHCQHNDFSKWLLARTEVILASEIRLLRYNCFDDV